MELGELHVDTGLRVEGQLGARGVEFLETIMDAKLQCPQLPVGDDQEVATSASRVEELDAPEVRQETLQIGFLGPCFREALLQLVEEQWTDELQDVGLGRVVLAQAPSSLLVLHCLEQ